MLVCLLTVSIGHSQALESQKSNPVSQYEVREFTYEDAQLLLKITAAEAGNQSLEGQIAVMTVILNRTYSDNPMWPDSIREVIYQAHQFSTVSNGTIETVEIGPTTHQALAEIEKGIPLDTEIVAFETVGRGSLTRYFDSAYTIGDHQFYKLK